MQKSILATRWLAILGFAGALIFLAFLQITATFGSGPERTMGDAWPWFTLSGLFALGVVGTIITVILIVIRSANERSVKDGEQEVGRQ